MQREVRRCQGAQDDDEGSGRLQAAATVMVAATTDDVASTITATIQMLMRSAGAAAYLEL